MGPSQGSRDRKPPDRTSGAADDPTEGDDEDLQQVMAFGAIDARILKGSNIVHQIAREFLLCDSRSVEPIRCLLLLIHGALKMLRCDYREAGLGGVDAVQGL